MKVSRIASTKAANMSVQLAEIDRNVYALYGLHRASVIFSAMHACRIAARQMK